jgi:hypothetical protein
MRDHHELFDWRVTRALFATGGMAFFAGIVLLVRAASWNAAWLIIAGLGIVALSTRGPWDSEASGRNRSVLGFHARPGKEVPR